MWGDSPGLTVVYQPQVNEYRLDIVLVHGMKGGGESINMVPRQRSQEILAIEASTCSLSPRTCYYLWLYCEAYS